MSLQWLTSTLTSFISGDANSDDSIHVDIDSQSLLTDTPDSTTTTTDKPSSSKSKAKTSKSNASDSQSSIQGLENLGNTCFFNASVQALLACPKFVEYITILSKKVAQSHHQFTPYEPLPEHERTDNKDSDKIFCQLLLDLHEGSITSPKELFQRLCQFHPTEFHQFTQSDAHESFNKMMEILEMEQLYIALESQSDNIIQDMFDFLDDDADEDEEDEKKSESSLNDIDLNTLKNPFHGLLGSTLECAHCKYENESRQSSFTCLTLSLTDSSMYGSSFALQTVHLLDRIAAFQIEEQIEGYRCMVCECKGIMSEIQHTLTNLKKHKDPEQGNPRPHASDTQIHVLQDQYRELHEKLSQLILNQYGYKKIQNGSTEYSSNHSNGTYLHENDKNGFHSTTPSLNINDISYYPVLSTKQKEKYRLNIASIKSYRTTAKKRQFVSRYPNVLCIHLNRLQFGAKDSRFVRFPSALNLSLTDKKIKAVELINAMFNENDLMLQNEYILMAVIVHHGSDSGGHYTTYKRAIGKKWQQSLEWRSPHELQQIQLHSEWYHISDEFVNKVKLSQVLMSQAYMLFYQKNQFSLRNSK
eukprot:CAMPEP_0197056702 /NCGR_PEP_ID=MMETSP1384-20130603/88795_1 /TAXON_ID=29189 /ORGANISM="Ammonia sp." /LENGTH=585 /DNA_ID=CAMNT_0042490813 /DNA_START=10 /DNA_END=1767 /DNA_ORIENTATION=-